MALEITVLVDDATERADFLAEHGMSLLLRGAFGQVLLDAGATGEKLAHNARAAGVRLEDVESVAISHGHYDHAGGLAWLAEHKRGLKVYCHPRAFEPRYVEHAGQPLKQIGMPVSFRRLRALGVELIEVTDPMRLHGDLLLSGPIGGPAYRAERFVLGRPDGLVEDPFADELFLMARGQAGWVLLTGCCHHGLINTLRLGRFLAKDEPIAAIVGGLHLRSADRAELGQIVESLDKIGQPAIHAGHCTGQAALEFFAESYGGQSAGLSAGARLVF